LDTERSQIQKVVGICAQENLLYPELTGAEHIELYARFKGLATGAGGARVLAEEVEARMDSVKLLPAKDRRAINYSGGMKRRLSVAIACIGSPSLLYLDEPTTGMDPLSRRRLWECLLVMKVQYTTHTHAIHYTQEYSAASYCLIHAASWADALRWGEARSPHHPNIILMLYSS
jgi:ABC-type multidrug transport system ATPase subunit